MEYRQKQIQKWANALRSGKYKQGKGCFQSEKGYCCLGVACKIFVKNPILHDGGMLNGTVSFNHHPNAPEWLLGISEDFKYKTDREEELWLLNDGKHGDDSRYTFDEIADILELVYIHEILED